MAAASRKVTIGQVGLGRWGRNLLRNFSSLPDCDVAYVCDVNADRRDRLAEAPQATFVSDIADVLRDDRVDAVVVATPAPAHYEAAKQSLIAGKHVFVEKPITLDVRQAEELVALAHKMNKKLVVGHLLLYHPAIVKLREMITAGDLGTIYYIYTQRLNLGTIRATENVMWSLAPHDISMVLHLVGGTPRSVSALGASFVQQGIEDVAFLNIRFQGGEIGHVHVSWLDPTKTRRTIVVGSKKMAVFDEMSNRDTLMVIDKGVDINPDYKNYEEFIKLRFGEGQTISLPPDEPLRLECQHFIDCILHDRTPRSNGENGVAVLKVLTAAERSLKNRGQNELF